MYACINKLNMFYVAILVPLQFFFQLLTHILKTLPFKKKNFIQELHTQTFNILP